MYVNEIILFVVVTERQNLFYEFKNLQFTTYFKTYSFDASNFEKSLIQNLLEVLQINLFERKRNLSQFNHPNLIKKLLKLPNPTLNFFSHAAPNFCCWPLLDYCKRRYCGRDYFFFFVYNHRCLYVF